MIDPKSPESPLLWMILGGLLAGLGKLLSSDQKITLRTALGRAIVSGSLGVAAGAGFLFWPDMPLEAAVGLAAGLSSLGTDGIIALLNRTKVL